MDSSQAVDEFYFSISSFVLLEIIDWYREWLKQGCKARESFSSLCVGLQVHDNSGGDFGMKMERAAEETVEEMQTEIVGASYF